MNFVPREIAKETCKRIREERLERLRRDTEERRNAYLKAKKEGKLDEYFSNLEKDL